MHSIQTLPATVTAAIAERVGGFRAVPASSDDHAEIAVSVIDQPAAATTDAPNPARST
ncbi:hypothetical protein [Actinoplanes regularis]|uniref:hypothetical protein n=1 Tax=Actinoplanes regularis TaxID=52697 RepID=UPI0025537737|nr:hypothetical protein [Actinoplanes regularis]